MNSPEFSRLEPGQRREQILDAADELFAERAYDEVSIEDIASSAGVTRGLVGPDSTALEGEATHEQTFELLASTRPTHLRRLKQAKPAPCRPVTLGLAARMEVAMIASARRISWTVPASTPARG